MIYKLTVGVVFIPERGFVKTYGIMGKQGEEIKHIDDISDDKEDVKRLVSLLNENDAALVHFPYIVNDWLIK